MGILRYLHLIFLLLKILKLRLEVVSSLNFRGFVCLELALIGLLLIEV